MSYLLGFIFGVFTIVRGKVFNGTRFRMGYSDGILNAEKKFKKFGKL